jgi:hypothetical protein
MLSITSRDAEYAPEIPPTRTTRQQVLPSMTLRYRP